MAEATRRRSALRRLRRRITRSDAFVGAIAFLAWAFIITYARTLRIHFEADPEHAPPDPRKILYGFWHGRQLLLASWYRGSGVAIMTDLSWAGDIQSRVLSRLGFTIVRGSSRRGGSRALTALRRAVEGGHSAALALDGPRGPIHRSKPGILLLARALDCPVVPLASSAAPAWTIPGTWCRYLLPLPFSRCVVKAGRPISVAPGEEVTTDDLDRAVAEVTEAADAAVGRRSDARGRGVQSGTC